MHIENQYIFILGTAKFDGPYESTSFTIAKQLAKKNFVFYVDAPFTWKDYFKLKHTKEFERRKNYFSLHSDGIIDTDIANLKVLISPPTLSINFLPEGGLYRKVLKVNDWLVANRIKKILKKYSIKKFIYINSFNFHYPNVGDFIKPTLQVYHCVDPMIIPYDMKHGIVSEEILVKRSKMVFCTSRQLFEEKKRQNNETYFIPNAADISHSSKALDDELPIHQSIAGLKRPIIGYLGNIERRFDFPLLKQVIESNSDKSFVFAGPTSPEFIPQWFYELPNIHLTGRIPYDQMPALLKGFDVAIIPFKKDDVSKTIFPLKLFEYLGAGKPVIATSFNPDLKEFTKDTVMYCDDEPSFSKAISETIEQTQNESLLKRLEIAKENTWENRVNELSKLLATRL